MTRRVLSIEDDPAVGALLRRELEFEGFEVTLATSAAEGLGTALGGGFDLILLDLRLPDGNGFELVAELRRQSDRTPVIVVSGRGDPVDKVRGLDSGADDFITKPFSRQELAARIRAVLRRTAPPPEAVSRLGRLEIDRRSRRVFKEGSEISLTRREFELLDLLSSRPGEVISRDEFLDRLWHDVFVSPRTVDTHIASLRRKLADEPGRPSVIESVRGVGYRLGDAGKRRGGSTES